MSGKDSNYTVLGTRCSVLGTRWTDDPLPAAGADGRHIDAPVRNAAGISSVSPAGIVRASVSDTAGGASVRRPNPWRWI